MLILMYRSSSCPSCSLINSRSGRERSNPQFCWALPRAFSLPRLSAAAAKSNANLALLIEGAGGVSCNWFCFSGWLAELPAAETGGSGPRELEGRGVIMTSLFSSRRNSVLGVARIITAPTSGGADTIRRRDMLGSKPNGDVSTTWKLCGSCLT